MEWITSHDACAVGRGGKRRVLGVAYDQRTPALAPWLAWRASMQVLLGASSGSDCHTMSVIVQFPQALSAAAGLSVLLAQAACCACCTRGTLCRCSSALALHCLTMCI